MTQEDPPPGWYEDPHEPLRERWWKGTEWGEHRRKGGREENGFQASDSMSPDIAKTPRVLDGGMPALVGYILAGILVVTSLVHFGQAILHDEPVLLANIYRLNGAFLTAVVCDGEEFGTTLGAEMGRTDDDYAVDSLRPRHLHEVCEDLFSQYRRSRVNRGTGFLFLGVLLAGGIRVWERKIAHNSGEQSLIVHIPGPPVTWHESLDEVENAIHVALEEVEAGEFDGYEISSHELTLFTYGPNANDLLSVVHPILMSVGLPEGSYAVKRYGAHGAPEQRVRLP